jgi:rhodanese-related sulfurtransferase
MDGAFVLKLLIVSLLAVFIFLRLAPVKGLRNLKGQTFQTQLQCDPNCLLLDVREPHEYYRGSIPEALNVPLSQIKSCVYELPKDKNIYLYCQSGMRSKRAAQMLKKNGYSNLAHLKGGILSWRGEIIIRK